MGPLPRHSGCQTLTGLTLEHLPGLRAGRRARHYRKGAIIWSVDDSADRIYFLERGDVAVRITDVEGRELTVRVIEAGQPFGELCFCAEQNGRRRTSAIALHDSDAAEITHADFLNYLQTSREALTALVITFCLRLSDAEARLGVLAQRGAEARLGGLLLQLARRREPMGQESAGTVTLHVTHDDLAHMAAMSRPHVTVTMGEFRSRGLVQYERNQPLLVNVKSLGEYLLGGLSE